MRIGYAPMNTAMTGPGDARRFVAYARRRHLRFELADPSQEYDLVVLTQMADISAWQRVRQGKIVYDFIDSYLAVPRTNIKQWLRGPMCYATGRHRHLHWDYWRALEDMCRRADAVVCSTQEQQALIAPYCPNTHIILDIHSAAINRIKTDYRAGTPFKLIWEGLPSNLAHLGQIAGVLRHLAGIRALELHAVTDQRQKRYMGRFGTIDSSKTLERLFDAVHFHPWTIETFANVVTSADLAVIPINLADPFAVGKPENKLLLFWRLGMPVVCSATPAYVRAMRAIQRPDLVCTSAEDWTNTLCRMIDAEALRQEAGERGRNFVETRYSEDALFSQWDALFESIGFSFRDVHA